jgi:single-strand DNA-binding protein
VAVTARYSPRSYDGNDGTKKHVHEFTAQDVRFLDMPSNRSDTPNNAQQDPFIDDGKPIDLSDDMLPF